MSSSVPIAARYDGLPTGPHFAYSFEVQDGIPIDAGSQLTRDLSPFTLRILPPSLLSSGSVGSSGVATTGTDVNSYTNANASVVSSQQQAEDVRAQFGIPSVINVGETSVLASLQQIVSAGQVVNSLTDKQERAVLVDKFTAADIAAQIERILQTSPLTLLVNPNSMSITYGTVQNFSNRTRKGFSFERWGESLPTINFSGSTGVFLCASSPSGSPFGGSTRFPAGAQTGIRRDSAAWQNFASLIQFYKNNGYIYDTIGRSQAHLMIGCIAIDYDQFTYTGHIESLDYSFKAETPFRVEWSMEFVCDNITDNATSVTSVQPHSLSGNFSPTGSFSSGTSTVSTTEQNLATAQTPFDFFVPTGFTR